MYRQVALARAIDERMWVLNRAGRVPFVISGQGHEGAQVGIVSALRPGHDWMVPFYRSVAACLTFGMTRARDHAGPVREGRRPLVGRPADAGSLRRRRAQHPVESSPVATQILHAAGIALAAKIRRTGQVAIDVHGRGRRNQGDFHEGAELRGIHQLPMILVVENNGYAISVPGVARAAGRGRRDPGGGLRHARA